MRSLENTRVGAGAIEGPSPFADVCVLCVRVPELRSSSGTGALWAQYVYMKEYLGRRRPRYAVGIGLAWPPTLPAKLGGLLGQLRPRAIAG